MASFYCAVFNLSGIPFLRTVCLFIFFKFRHKTKLCQPISDFSFPLLPFSALYLLRHTNPSAIRIAFHSFE